MDELEAIFGRHDRVDVVEEQAPRVDGRAEFVLVLGGSASGRRGAAIALARQRLNANAAARIWTDPHVERWPFDRHLLSRLPAADDLVVLAFDIGSAFPDRQVNGTRLVLTQSTYQLQMWLDTLDRRASAFLVATADPTTLGDSMQEITRARGAWSRCRVLRVVEAADAESHGDRRGVTTLSQVEPHGAQALHDEASAALAAAFADLSPVARFEACRAAAERWPDSPVVLVALASACMENLALDAARDALASARALAEEWGVVHYEEGKVYLRTEQMEEACHAFARACAAMPTFAPAFSNYGATLGELDRPEEALAAFERARHLDPFGFQVVNNIGVVNRELGRLDASEQALRDVVAMAPDFVFGHYNLGHTLFLAGRFAESVAAYEAGQSRDTQRNAIQAARLALARLASGDPARASDELLHALREVTPDRREQLRAECLEILGALQAWQPGLSGVDPLLRAVGG